MSALAARQREFIEAIFGEGEPAPALGVYRRHVLANLRGALAATYPVVARLVGPAFFDEAARGFALACPSASGDLNEYGAGFAIFLAGYEHARSLAYLPDVARLEWACHESMNAPEADAFDFAALAQIPPERYGEIRFLTHPSLRLLRSPHPIAAIWQANQAGRDGTPDRDSGAEHVVVRRDEGEVRVEAIDEATWMLAAAFAAGATLATAGVELAALPRLVADRILVGFDAAPRA